MAALQTLEDPTFMPGDSVYHKDIVADFARDYNISNKMNRESRETVDIVGIDKDGEEVVGTEYRQSLNKASDFIRPEDMPSTVLDYQLAMIKKAMTYKY